ncbi:DivIVA domain-containing protein [Micrococcus terreus]|uniref:DivIVA domain-containing protein n=1 Tax=Micrococcus terreus TaxID=574650 RepID=UPI0023F73236|nr:DivIVA domain-containing protein [Micrococcus terreus]
MAFSSRSQPAPSGDSAGPSQVPDPVEPGSSELPFGRVSGKDYGYHSGQVEEFMTRARQAYEQGIGLTAREVRHAVFDAVRGGYSAEAVDEALDRLEDTLAQAERDERIAAEGIQAWAESRRAEREVLLGRLNRPAGERFRRPTAVKAASYDQREVDALCERIGLTLGADPALAGSGSQRGPRRPVSVDDVRRCTFEAAEGEPGYDEAQVDAFLDAVIEYLSGEDRSLTR